MTLDAFGNMSIEEFALQKAKEQSKLGDHVVTEGYGGAADREIENLTSIIDQNTRMVNQVCNKLCDHFYGTTFAGLPDSMQKETIESFSPFKDKNDVVYHGMVQRWEQQNT